MMETFYKKTTMFEFRGRKNINALSKNKLIIIYELQNIFISH